MNRMSRWVVMGLAVAAPQIAGCQKQAAQTTQDIPATVEHVEGTEISKVTLTEDAMKRLDVKTSAVTEEKSPRTEQIQKAVPYGALIYDPSGSTWIYTNPHDRVFVREQVDVDFIDGNLAYLTKGPEVGTSVATLGVVELYGTEFPVGH